MRARPLRSAALAGLIVLLVAGCTPDRGLDEPAPLFTSEAEAFAAAEQTYRAYVDALNAVDLSDPRTFEPVYALTTGDANAGERESLSRMHADGWSVSGTTVVESVHRETAASDLTQVRLSSCNNVSSILLVDAMGHSKVGATRPAVQSVAIRLTRADSSATSYRIDSITGGDRPCD